MLDARCYVHAKGEEELI